jgi:three-Cys-motif partner protein
MKKQPWQRRYIDAFSGTGRWERPGAPAPDVTPLLPSEINMEALNEQEQVLKGSVERALDVEPHFHRIDLIEQNAEKAIQLRSIAPRVADQEILVHNSDANTVLIDLCRSFKDSKERAVLFLDPFGCQVEWRTLQHIADTKAIDVWYLFPAGWINRMLVRDPAKIDPAWARRISLCLGTNQWRSEFYAEALGKDLFGETQTTRQAGPSAVERYFMKRLAELFPATADDCIRLINGTNSHMFSLCFAIANPSRDAIQRAKDIANHLIKQWETPIRG